MRAGKIINDNANYKVEGSDKALAGDQGFVVFARVTHLRRNREKRGCTGVREDEGRHGINSDIKRRPLIRHDLVIRNPLDIFWYRRWMFLNPNSDSSDHDYI